MNNNENIDMAVNLLTHCDSSLFPERFEIVMKCISSLKSIKSENVNISLWDNSSSEDVKNFLNNQSFIDQKCFSNKNLLDVVAVNFLLEKAKKINAEFVMHLEDDFFFYEKDWLDEALAFLRLNKDCGYLRILKYDVSNKKKYTKNSGHPEGDRANWQRHENYITKSPLVWEKSDFGNKYDFYKVNWHWYNFVNICRTDVFEKIVPKHNIKPLQGLEGYMMKKYAELGLKVGVMDRGVVTHMGLFDEKKSLRISKTKNNKQQIFSEVCYNEVKEEINKFL